MAYTSFFRDSDVLDMVVKHVVPEVSHRSRIKIWDAGCATGEEPYSLAMVLAEALGPFGLRAVSILATDREESAFAQFERIIADGLYDRQAVSWIPEPYRTKYVHPSGAPEQFRIDDMIKAQVRYKRNDLLAFDPPETDFHLIVCKNVVMHFNPFERAAVLAMFWRVLLPDGFLALDRFQQLPEETRPLFTRVGGEGDGQLLRKVG